MISANPDELQQVWTNIIQNALQAMEFKGSLTIDIEQKTGKNIGAISLGKEQTFVVVSFTDDGPGINPSIRESLFEALITTKAPGEGSGLGLHICKRIINDHNGEITFSSESGKTKFEVWLPIEKNTVQDK